MWLKVFKRLSILLVFAMVIGLFHTQAAFARITAKKKYEVIKGLADHPDTGNKDRAALILGCTKRHINRMLKGYNRFCKDFFVHGNRGKKPATAISLEIRKQVIDLYRTKYFEANFEHYTELLKKNEGISISASSVISILESEYILSPKATKTIVLCQDLVQIKMRGFTG